LTISDFFNVSSYNLAQNVLIDLQESTQSFKTLMHLIHSNPIRLAHIRVKKS